MLQNGAQALIKSMENQGIKYVFGIPGAKVDKLFEELQYCTDKNKPKIIVARHEQNAVFMAGGIGRISGKPGVTLTTSGPGVSNLTTGLITATAEGDPIIALGGQVPRDDLYRLTHQSIPSSQLLLNATKSSEEIQNSNNLSEAFTNAYKNSIAPKAGATFISLPSDVLSAKVTRSNIEPLNKICFDEINKITAQNLSKIILQAKQPVILAGMRASSNKVTESIRRLVKKFDLSVVETFQGAGIINRQLENDYFGRVGIFNNQIGDQVLKAADLVLAIGYDPIEYEARNWNLGVQKFIINLDSIAPEISSNYQPNMVIQANISKSLNNLTKIIPNSKKGLKDKKSQEYLKKLKNTFDDARLKIPKTKKGELHPLSIIKDLQEIVDDDTTVTVDVGSHYIWMARYFRSYQPRHLLFSNGMQTLGVSLPWAIAASLLRPQKPVISVSGDGGFLFSGQELETAVRLHCKIIQLIWVDGYYDMVRFQEIEKYGKDAGDKFGPVDYVKYAQSFGAKGYRATSNNKLLHILSKAKKEAQKGPVVIEIPVDYSDNPKLQSLLLKDVLNN